MASPPSPQAIRQLYHQSLRAASSFASYNYRQYFIQRTRDSFRQHANEKDPDKIAALYEKARGELNVLRRQALINRLYEGPRLVVEKTMDIVGGGAGMEASYGGGGQPQDPSGLKGGQSKT